jgi:asparagine synthase (glutamine-hydrolysing)
MCGIVGLISPNSDFQLEKSIKLMLEVLNHRGPDGSGTWIDSNSGVALGHKRLAVIDISVAGHQPMVSRCGRYLIVFNGEIYNHLTLRNKLKEFDWRGSSDTETLLECISQWGINKTLKSLSGMFAFALWDIECQSLILARDRLGEKPLYYGWSNNNFVFGSELKALKKIPKFNNPINRDALALYFQFSNIPSPYSIYEDIHKLEPGHFLILKRNQLNKKVTEIKPFWTVNEAAKKSGNNIILDVNEAITETESCLRRSLSEQSIADVPLGAFLSGGIDSSLIVSLLQTQSNKPIQTFTVGFDEKKFDESIYAAEVANHLGTEHNEIRVTYKDAISVVDKLPELYDEPFSDSSQIPTYLICQAARSKVTVALTGDGGDELFGGYNRYFWGPTIWKKIRWAPYSSRKLIGKTIKSISLKNWDNINKILPKNYSSSRLGEKAHKFSNLLFDIDSIEELYIRLVSEWQKDDKLVLNRNIISTKLDDIGQYTNLKPEDMMMMMDIRTYLTDDILTKVDRASMGVSLETRAPFLDYRLAELALRIPVRMKIRDNKGKLILRQILEKHVPNKMIDRPKLGFGVPIGDWICGPLREWAEDLLDRKSLEEQGYLNADLVHKFWNEHLHKKADWTGRIWSILMFQAWLRNQEI